MIDPGARWYGTSSVARAAHSIQTLKSIRQTVKMVRHRLTAKNNNGSNDTTAHLNLEVPKSQKHSQRMRLGNFTTLIVVSIFSTVAILGGLNANVQPATSNPNWNQTIGHKDNNLINTASTTPGTFTVDILSVSSIKQLELLRAQEKTMGSHGSVRNFFNATELDDADPTCHLDVTWDHVSRVSSYCRRNREALSHIFQYLRGQFARTQWLEKKKNPAGWLCAQTRPMSGIMKVNLYYKSTGEPLPDYLVVMDDDTYYNRFIT